MDPTYQVVISNHLSRRIVRSGKRKEMEASLAWAKPALHIPRLGIHDIQVPE
jgi:hypothetical protein